MRARAAVATLALVAAGAWGCPQADGERPDVEGTYPIRVTVVDGDCLAGDPTLPPTSFLTWMAANGQAGMLEIEQQDKDLSCHFEECELAGLVESDASLYIGGECADAGGAVITVTATGAFGEDPDDSTRATIDAVVQMDIDHSDAAGGEGADGEVDCHRSVRIDGTSL